MHEMLAGSHAGQELNYLLSVGADTSPTAASGAPTAARRHVDASDGHMAYGMSSHKPLAALQADSHMKHVDMCASNRSKVQPIPCSFDVAPQIHLGQRCQWRARQVAPLRRTRCE